MASQTQLHKYIEIGKIEAIGQNQKSGHLNETSTHGYLIWVSVTLLSEGKDEIKPDTVQGLLPKGHTPSKFLKYWERKNASFFRTENSFEQIISDFWCLG